MVCVGDQRRRMHEIPRAQPCAVKGGAGDACRCSLPGDDKNILKQMIHKIMKLAWPRRFRFKINPGRIVTEKNIIRCLINEPRRSDNYPVERMPNFSALLTHLVRTRSNLV